MSLPSSRNTDRRTRSDGRSEGGSLSSSAPHSVGDSTESTEVIGGIVDEPDRRFPYLAPVRQCVDAKTNLEMHRRMRFCTPMNLCTDCVSSESSASLFERSDLVLHTNVSQKIL